jgi:hypothetical protein
VPILNQKATMHLRCLSDDAEQLLLEIIEGSRLKLGDKHPHIIESIKNLIELYKSLNKSEKA